MQTSYTDLSFVYTANHITPREIQVLAFMAQGKSNKEIAGRLNISTETVKKHVKNIYQKTGSHNKIEALNKTKWLTDPLVTSQY